MRTFKLSIVLAVLPFACGTEQPKPATDASGGGLSVLATSSSTAGKLWPLAVGNDWSMRKGDNSRLITVTASRQDEFAVEGLFRQPRWLRAQGQNVMLLNDNTGEWSDLIRGDAVVGERYQIYTETGPCGHYEATVQANDAQIVTPAGTFVDAEVFSLVFKPEGAPGCCLLPPAFVGIALVSGVGPIALDVNGGGYDYALVNATLSGDVYPDSVPRVTTEDLFSQAAALNGRVVTYVSTVKPADQACTKRKCAMEDLCCNTCEANYSAGALTLRGGAPSSFGCGGDSCDIKCSPLSVSSQSYALTGVLHNNVYGEQVLDVHSFKAER